MLFAFCSLATEVDAMVNSACVEKLKKIDNCCPELFSFRQTQGSVQRRANTMTGPEDVAFLERFEYKPPPEMTHIFGTVEDEYLQENAEQTEAQLNEEKGENQTEGQNEPRSCTPTSNQTSEESRKEHASVETSLTCSCKSASQSNLPDVIQTDYKGNDRAKNDSTV